MSLFVNYIIMKYISPVIQYYILGLFQKQLYGDWGGGIRKAVKLKFDPWWVFLMSSIMCYLMSGLIKMVAWWVQK